MPPSYSGSNSGSGSGSSSRGTSGGSSSSSSTYRNHGGSSGSHTTKVTKTTQPKKGDVVTIQHGLPAYDRRAPTPGYGSGIYY